MKRLGHLHLNARSATRRTRLLALIATVGWVMPAASAAQEATEFYACYVPEVGAMYLINLPGLPADCLSENHEPISWRDGGDLAPGSVAAEHLASRSVTSEALADGAVGSRELASGAVSGDHLDLGLHWYPTPPAIWVGNNGASTMQRSCPDGERVLSAGWSSIGRPHIIVFRSWAINDSTWELRGRNPGEPTQVALLLLCGNVPLG